MSETVKAEAKPAGLVEGLRDIQGQYMMLADLFEKEKAYAIKLTEIVKELQQEADEVIPLRPEAIGENCQAAYLVSEAVVVMFDSHRKMTSKPFSQLPAGAIVSAIQDSTSALGRMIAEKRRTESERVDSLEKVLKELKKTQATFKSAALDEAHGAHYEGAILETKASPDVQGSKEEVKQEAQPEVPVKMTPPKEAFKFKGVYGDKGAREEVSA